MNFANFQTSLRIFRESPNHSWVQSDQIWRNFDTILLVFGNAGTVYLVFGKIINLLW